MGQSKPIDTKTILIVEGEAIIRFDLIDFFEDHGYRVFEAVDTDDAIAILEREARIRIVFTDVDMPGSIDGLRLAHYIRERYPPTLLFLGSVRLQVPEADLPTRCVFMSKPFDHGRLLRMIETMTR